MARCARPLDDVDSSSDSDVSEKGEAPLRGRRGAGGAREGGREGGQGDGGAHARAGATVGSAGGSSGGTRGAGAAVGVGKSYGITYPRPSGWEPSAALFQGERCFGGGAYPEAHVYQYPLGLGRRGAGRELPEVLLQMPHAELLARAARHQMAQGGTATPEYESFLRFAARAADVVGAAGGGVEAEAEAVVGVVARAMGRVRRVRALRAAEAEALLVEGEGTPVVVEDGMRGWDRAALTPSALAERTGDALVLANDRAPARRADSRPGASRTGARKQRTVQLPLREYVDYTADLPGFEALAAGGGVEHRDRAPFYLNGWRAFSDGEVPSAASLRAACPQPYFTAAIDHNDEILAEMGRLVFGAGEAKPGAVSADAWAETTGHGLQKIFMSPAGAITRLHYDCHDAHAWLGQAHGRKLFVCYPPSDTPYLGRLDGEPETAQAAVDPLEEEMATLRRTPEYSSARPHAFVLRPGEVVLVPRGWWHYAVSLDQSVTVMKNFYHKGTNLESMIRMLVQAGRESKGRQPKQEVGAEGPV